MTLKIAIVNAQSGVGSVKSRFTYFASVWKYALPHSNEPLKVAGKMMRDEQIDIALITEISEKSLRTGFLSQINLLAHYSEITEKKFFSTQKTLTFHEGNGILSRYPILSSESFPLPSGKIKRILAKTVIEINSRKINVFVTHLGLDSEERIIQLQKIEEIIKQIDGPVLLGGDFNFRDTFTFKKDIAERLIHVATLSTFPSWKPTYALDYLFLTKEFAAIKKYIPSSPAFSDHVALVVETEFD